MTSNIRRLETLVVNLIIASIIGYFLIGQKIIMRTYAEWYWNLLLSVIGGYFFAACLYIFATTISIISDLSKQSREKAVQKVKSFWQSGYSGIDNLGILVSKHERVIRVLIAIVLIVVAVLALSIERSLSTMSVAIGAFVAAVQVAFKTTSKK